MNGPVTRRRRACALAVVLGALTACSQGDGVTWSDVRYVATAPIPAPDAGAATVPAGACPGSLRTVQAGGDTYAAWWAIRPDSSSALMTARSTDGGRTWLVTAPADTTDRSRRGCARPAPDVAASAATHYFDIAYFLEPAEGPGIFFTHTMDAPHLGTPNAVFHSPVAVMYGAHPARVAVATRGDDVVVAYEDPNSEREMIGLALSRTMGHLFDARVMVSNPDLPATDPRVALAGDTVVVQWAERPDSLARGGRIAVRRGVWRR
jgi:hypothetical protein